MTVNPELVDAPAARLPLPFGRIVMTLPPPSQLGLPFQVAETFCGEVTVTVAVHLTHWRRARIPAGSAGPVTAP